tara:strand:+ start:215 stop:727 length:513 start_codon:yes stop_codon:yes gene_type:complete
MSLAINAAPFEPNKKIMNQKNKINSFKISNVLNKIHETSDEDDCFKLDDFVPLPNTQSAGVEKTKFKEGIEMNSDTPEYSKLYDESINYLNEQSNIPYNQPDINFINTIPPLPKNENNLEKKINKILKLLEEQKDYRTNNVTEEIVLYSFFGIFIIYVIDSFKTVGKYTR